MNDSTEDKQEETLIPGDEHLFLQLCWSSNQKTAFIIRNTLTESFLKLQISLNELLIQQTIEQFEVLYS